MKHANQQNGLEAVRSHAESGANLHEQRSDQEPRRPHPRRRKLSPAQRMGLRISTGRIAFGL